MSGYMALHFPTGECGNDRCGYYGIAHDHTFIARLAASATDEGLRAALTAIRDLTLDVPAAHGDPESYYLGQLRTAIGTAARALAASATDEDHR